ncbi:diguanylate cyclase domain-containing protein [Vibrio galatheae]|nr:diguanylate cyclase [Vibrio galatheae]
MEEEELQASTEDYAAWTTMARYVTTPNDTFVAESIGPHAFSSKQIDAIAIFDAESQSVWGGAFSDDAVVNMPFFTLEKQEILERVLAKVKSTSTEQIQSFAEYAVYDNSVYMVVSSRICLSSGKDCKYGYLLFIRKIRPETIAEMETSTGVGIDIYPAQDNAVAKPNTTILYRDNVVAAGSKVAIEVTHNEVLPEFLPRAEVAALTLFALITFAFNLYVVTRLVKPLKTAQRNLEQFQTSGGRLTSEDIFISQEMRSFARQLNSLITELEEKRAILRKQSTIDSLTEIANRRLLYEKGQELINDLKYKHIAVVLIDVDHFKLYNDNYGHVQGDGVLRRVAKTIDAIETPYEKLVSRYGGEEFCVLLASDRELNIESYVAEIHSSIEQLHIEHKFSPTTSSVTVSIGAMAGVLDSYQQLTTWFQYADQALYEVKNAGRNGYKIRS